MFFPMPDTIADQATSLGLGIYILKGGPIDGMLILHPHKMFYFRISNATAKQCSCGENVIYILQEIHLIS